MVQSNTPNCGPAGRGPHEITMKIVCESKLVLQSWTNCWLLFEQDIESSNIQKTRTSNLPGEDTRAAGCTGSWRQPGTCWRRWPWSQRPPCHQLSARQSWGQKPAGTEKQTLVSVQCTAREIRESGLCLRGGGRARCLTVTLLRQEDSRVGNITIQTTLAISGWQM